MSCITSSKRTQNPWGTGQILGRFDKCLVLDQPPRKTFSFIRAVCILPVILIFACSSTENHTHEIAPLQDEVTIEFDNQLVPHIKAKSQGDAFITQGYLHGISQGRKLVDAVSTFKGKAPKECSNDHTLLSRIFEHIPMEQIASQCLKLYPAETEMAMNQYLKGLQAGYPDYAWTLNDILILHRGYAFLMSDSLAQAWISMVQSNSSQQGSSPLPFYLSGDVLPLFQGPSLEFVRQSKTTPFSIQTRAVPSWSFVFQPIRITTPQFSSEGMGLAGLPFLWTGSTSFTQFIQTPINGQSSFIFSMDREKAELLNAISDSLKLEDLKKQGVSIPIISSNKNTTLSPRLYWAGFRPSADLHMLYTLLKTQSLEQASYAPEKHQIPFVELILSAPPFSPLQLHVGTTSLTPQRVLSRSHLFPFPGNAIQKTNPIPSVNSFTFHFNGDNQTDTRLLNTMAHWLNGPLKQIMTPENWKKASELFSKEHPHNEVAIQLLWRELFSISKKEYPVEYTLNKHMDIRDTLLIENDRSLNTEDNQESLQKIRRLGQLLSGIAMEITNSESTETLLTYYLPDNPKFYYNLPPKSPSYDNPDGFFFTGFQSEIIRCTTHQIKVEALGEKPINIRTFPFAVTGKPTIPKGTSWNVKPTLTLIPPKLL